jgi:NADH-quinone oxidoreductase subunit J
MVQAATFYAFAAILIFAALRVVTTRNPVHAALWLVLSFFSAAGIWLLLQAEFLAIALMVLFLFVVMMLDVNFEKMRERFRSYIPVAFVVGALVLFEMALVVWGAYSGDRAVPPEASASYSNTKALGMLIYTEYAYPFELAGFLLLVAIIAAIALTHRRRRETKYQNPAAQVRVRRDERLRIVQMPAEKREP